MQYVHIISCADAEYMISCAPRSLIVVQPNLLLLHCADSMANAEIKMEDNRLPLCK